MEELERKRLHWQKVTAVVCILLLIVVTASSALAFVGVRRYARASSTSSRGSTA